MTPPDFCLGALGPGQSCQTSSELGPFGARWNFRKLGLRKNTNSTYYATLDGVLKYTTSITFATAMEPSVVAEANDDCGFSNEVSADYNAVSDNSLAWHDNARGWQFWTTQYNTHSLDYPADWNSYRPGGTSASFSAYGASPKPSIC